MLSAFLPLILYMDCGEGQWPLQGWPTRKVLPAWLEVEGTSDLKAQPSFLPHLLPSCPSPLPGVSTSQLESQSTRGEWRELVPGPEGFTQWTRLRNNVLIVLCLLRRAWCQHRAGPEKLPEPGNQVWGTSTDCLSRGVVTAVVGHTAGA